MVPKPHTLMVIPPLPPRLAPLQRLARNLWYTWHAESVDLFRRLDRELWAETYHNPVLMLSRISTERLDEVARDESFLLHMDRVVERLDQYVDEKSVYSFHLQKNLDPSFLVAYFAAEYGLTECVPIYSGGLGVLSGDTLKSGSNLCVPEVGIGLLYQKGYFGQRLDAEGWQQEYYVSNDFDNMPLTQVHDPEGKPLAVTVRIGEREVKAEIWSIRVGRVPLYLMSTNLEENHPEDREITFQLYGGDRDMRIRQEILLGMGGVKALEALGLRPTVFHMNEGHSAFAQLERIRTCMGTDGLSFEAAKEMVKANSVFTTHTPVPAGNDYFDGQLMERYFTQFAQELGLAFPEIMALGRQHPRDESEPFCMTVLALKLSNFRNGVSELHRDVSRQMWRGIWPQTPTRDIPIVAVTNGVHIPSYISKEMEDLFNRYLGPRWIEDPDNQKVWSRVEQIPDTELWRTHERRRERLIGFARRRLNAQLTRRGALPSEINAVDEVLEPEALTIGFARRFATYKRGDILFRDSERLEKILNNPERPVQIIFAGKAHPRDNEGKKLIQNIVQFTRKETFRYRVVFLEDYDINVARYMVQGVDVWMNTPRRPHEACGTSGMKAVANGALHMSILDGWWVEGYGPDRGWAIGAGEEHEDVAYQDEVESKALYDLLEKEVVPLFYERTRDGTARRWIAMMKASMGTLCPIFNTHRMVEDYVDRFYLPAFDRFSKIDKADAGAVESFVAWKERVASGWGDIEVKRVLLPTMEKGVVAVGSDIPVRVWLSLGRLAPDDVSVELYYGPLDSEGEFVEAFHVPMQLQGEASEGEGILYQGTIQCGESGKMGFHVRILPSHPLMLHPCDMGLVWWG